MRTWLLIGLLVTAMVVVMWLQRTQSQSHEGFITVDLATAQAQRQQLQFEGERRYNDLARLQEPDVSLDPARVTAAVQQVAPVPSSQTPSLLSLLGLASFGAADDGSNKLGAGVEQTGTVAAKIAFCESLKTVDCDQLNDPRMAECGFCHRDGKDSTGKAHRGGMYISSRDQIAANERANSAGGAAVYKPTVGSCKPQNFTLMAENCKARELQLQCQSAGAPTLNNVCGQCYGGAPSTATGLLFMGPKPRQYTATLWVSHPGGHSGNGAGTVVARADGTILATLAPSGAQLLDPKSMTIEITEGDNLVTTVMGAPAVWCAWLSSPDGKRTVSVDVGATDMQPTNGFVIAGDKRSTIVTKLMKAGPEASAWPAFQKQVPNTVLWYQRRDEVVPGMIVTAWYGTGASDPSTGVDVSTIAKLAAGANADFNIVPTNFNISDPAPGVPKHLWIYRDNGDTVIGADGQTLPARLFYNVMQLSMTVPATLVDPIFDADKEDCKTGPIVMTEIGAGLMGSHSCFKPDGSFNPTQYCLQELFVMAGGTNAGTAYPNTDDKAAALVRNDKKGKPSLDATVAYLNGLGNIAIYGVDMNGVAASFTDYVSAAQAMLGFTPKNPCDGPSAANGPHTAECIDYLWRTSGNPAADGQQMDPDKVPYSYCSKAGVLAPIGPDGKVNQANVTTANSYGGVAGVRNYFQSIYNRTLNSNDFDDQAAAMQQCFNVTVQKPAPVASACPPKNPTEWHCFTPQMLSPPEVFMVAPNGYTVTKDNAQATCDLYGARVATTADLTAAQAAGADWCKTGWVADDTNAKYPINFSTGQGCGNGSTGVITWNPPGGLAGVNCFGVKPAPGSNNAIQPFGLTWSQASEPGLGNTVSFSPAATSGNYLRHANFLLWSMAPDLDSTETGALMTLDGSFVISPPNNGKQGYVSIQSVNYPGYFWRHMDFRVHLMQPDGSPPFVDDSSFKVVQPLVAGTTNGFSFESSNFPGYYLSTNPQDSTGGIWLRQIDTNSQADMMTATFIGRVALAKENFNFSDSAVPAIREVANQVQCASSDGASCYLFKSEDECNAWVSNPASDSTLNTVSSPAIGMASLADQYFRGRV
jgi:hypothetical protein